MDGRWRHALAWVTAPLALLVVRWHSPLQAWSLDPVSTSDIYVRFALLLAPAISGLIGAGRRAWLAWSGAPEERALGVLVAIGATVLVVVMVFACKVFVAWRCWGPSCGPPEDD